MPKGNVGKLNDPIRKMNGNFQPSPWSKRRENTQQRDIILMFDVAPFWEY